MWKTKYVSTEKSVEPKKETLRAKIKMAIKEILVKVVDARVEYNEIDTVASEIYEHIEVLYAA